MENQCTKIRSSLTLWESRRVKSGGNRFSESSTADCHHSKLNGTVFGMHDWPDSLRGQAAMYRKLAEQTDDPFVKHELLGLASVCEEVANNIEDHLTGGYESGRSEHSGH